MARKTSDRSKVFSWWPERLYRASCSKVFPWWPERCLGASCSTSDRSCMLGRGSEEAMLWKMNFSESAWPVFGPALEGKVSAVSQLHVHFLHIVDKTWQWLRSWCGSYLDSFVLGVQVTVALDIQVTEKQGTKCETIHKNYWIVILSDCDLFAPFTSVMRSKESRRKQSAIH